MSASETIRWVDHPVGLKAYRTTHPWLKFDFELDSVPGFWIEIGRAQSLCETIGHVPMTEQVRARLHKVYLAKGVHATTAIEGNTLSEDQVRAQLNAELAVSRSEASLKQETANVIALFGLLFETPEPSPVTPEWIGNMNAMLLRNLDLPDHVKPGIVRTYPISVAGYMGPPFQDCDYLLRRLCEWLAGPAFRAVDPSRAIAHAIVKAVVAHVYLALIHPFGDGNGRTARSLELQILADAGVPTAAAHLLTNHYHATQTTYYAKLAETSRTGGDLRPFLRYAVTGFVDQLVTQQEVIRGQQLAIAWQVFVAESLEKESGPVAARRKLLLRDMFSAGAKSADELALLSPRVAAAYARKTPKTLSRDLNALRKQGLVVKEGRAYSANRAAVAGFMPGRKEAGRDSYRPAMAPSDPVTRSPSP